MSPPHEEHMELLDNEFCFGGQYVKPLTEVSFTRDKSGNDLTMSHPNVSVLFVVDQLKKLLN